MFTFKVSMTEANFFLDGTGFCHSKMKHTGTRTASAEQQPDANNPRGFPHPGLGAKRGAPIKPGDVWGASSPGSVGFSSNRARFTGPVHRSLACSQPRLSGGRAARPLPPFPLTTLMDRQPEPARSPTAPPRAPLPPLLRLEPGPRQRSVLPLAPAGCASHRELVPWPQRRRLAGTIATSTAPPGLATSGGSALGSRHRVGRPRGSGRVA